jgi:hypothetical protein
MRFSIRDLLWLTLVAAMALGWLCWWRSIPVPVEGFIRGTVLVSGKPISSGRALLHSADGQFRGTQVVNGSFDLQGVPYGKYLLTFEGDDVPTNKFPAELNSDWQALGVTLSIGPPAAGSLAAKTTTPPAAPRTGTSATR